MPTATNSFPTNLFLTDNGRLFWYKKGERLVETRVIEEAQKSQESRPAERDPEGHWGAATNGFQLSLRFEKADYTNGEPVTGIILLRNVSDKPLKYTRAAVIGHPSPIAVSVWKDGKKANLKTDDGMFIVPSAIGVTVHPRTQHRYQLRLERFYDLSQSGTYSVQAEFDVHAPQGVQAFHDPARGELTSQKVTISITNSPHATSRPSH
jgi:hypothetical protein